jgi:three-Cys-motif partner protein
VSRRSTGPNLGDQTNFGLAEPRVVGTAEIRPRSGRKKQRASERELSKRPQTRLKLDSLVAYLPQWFGIASNKSTDAHYIDAFAGAGHYPDGAATAKGSPVIACEAAIDAVEAQKLRGQTWRPHLRFVERSNKTTEELRTELARFDGLLDYKVIEDDAAKVLPGLIAETVGYPTLVFMDPDGFAPVTFDLLKSLAGRRKMTEILLSVDAQGLMRAHARGETVALTAFSGGEWWSGSLGIDGLLDLHSYFRSLCERLGSDALFPYASVQHLEFLSNHAHRAIIQCCMSAEGPKRWNAAMRRSRAEMRVVDAFFPDLDEHDLVNEIIDRLRSHAGHGRFTFRNIINALPDVAWTEAAVHQGLLFLRDCGLASWSSRLGRASVPPPRFRFESGWPTGLVWDGQTRSERPVDSLAEVTPAR